MAEYLVDVMPKNLFRASRTLEQQPAVASVQSSVEPLSLAAGESLILDTAGEWKQCLQEAKVMTRDAIKTKAEHAHNNNVLKSEKSESFNAEKIAIELYNVLHPHNDKGINIKPNWEVALDMCEDYVRKYIIAAYREQVGTKGVVWNGPAVEKMNLPLMKQKENDDSYSPLVSKILSSFKDNKYFDPGQATPLMVKIIYHAVTYNEIWLLYKDHKAPNVWDICQRLWKNYAKKSGFVTYHMEYETLENKFKKYNMDRQSRKNIKKYIYAVCGKTEDEVKKAKKNAGKPTESSAGPTRMNNTKPSNTAQRPTMQPTNNPTDGSARTVQSVVQKTESITPVRANAWLKKGNFLQPTPITRKTDNDSKNSTTTPNQDSNKSQPSNRRPPQYLSQDEKRCWKDFYDELMEIINNLKPGRKYEHVPDAATKMFEEACLKNFKDNVNFKLKKITTKFREGSGTAGEGDEQHNINVITKYQKAQLKPAASESSAYSTDDANVEKASDTSVQHSKDNEEIAADNEQSQADEKEEKTEKDDKPSAHGTSQISENTWRDILPKENSLAEVDKAHAMLTADAKQLVKEDAHESNTVHEVVEDVMNFAAETEQFIDKTTQDNALNKESEQSLKQIEVLKEQLENEVVLFQKPGENKTEIATDMKKISDNIFIIVAHVMEQLKFVTTPKQSSEASPRFKEIEDSKDTTGLKFTSNLTEQYDKFHSLANKLRHSAGKLQKVITKKDAKTASPYAVFPL